jgi:hypothetical protein
MLGVLRAALPGAAFAQTWPTLISLWEFDETSGPSFADSGPANVPMTIVGTWADLSTPSMIQGIAGTSAYTNGSGYATIAANDPDHDLSELTISFYYQRNSAAAKHVLLAAGDGTQPGDFSIEVLANGRLRGYHVGQDGVLRFFESGSGVTGTNLQVGSAHRIDLTLGSLGARIYLDAAPLGNAFIPANTNGWNNTRVKHLGIFPGELSPADGAFDGMRIWNRQLTSQQIATLEPAQSIGLPQNPQELSVASLAEWLKSDEADPTPTKFVSNQNRGNGSGSSPENAQELQAALNGASAGQTFLAVCQTAGTVEFWNYPNGLAFPSGSAGNFITLQARQGDGVVISAGENWSGARTSNSGFWTQSGLSADDVSKQIWRSANAVGGAEAMIGWWIEFGHPHQLISAGSMTNLRATYGTADSPTNYSGPMVHKDTDGRVYIRMQRPHPGKYSFGGKWSRNVWPNNPEAVNSSGELVYPISQNPNDYPIYLCRANQSLTAFNPGVSGGFIKIGSGINSMGFQSCLVGHDIVMRRGLHYAWRYFVRSNNDTTNKRRDYDIQRVRATDGSKIHVARAEWKFEGWLEALFRSAFIESPGSDALENLYFKDCTIADYHEIMVTDRAIGFRFRNCTFLHIHDDGIQSASTVSRFEFGYCYFRGSAYGGTGGQTGTGTDPGQWYIHHNILDFREERCTNWRAQPHPGFPYLGHSPSGNQPRKYYNNTFLWGPDTEETSHAGYGHNEDTENSHALAHEVFNNLNIRMSWGTRYDPTAGAKYSFFLTGRSDSLSEYMHYDPNRSNEFWDYNLYYRDMQGTTLVEGILWNVGAGAQSNNERASFASLAAWYASPKFTTSKGAGTRRGAYPPGFEGNSTETKPTMPSLDNFPADRFKYRPSPTSAVTTATVSSLSGANWWNTPPSWGAAYFPWNDGENTLAPSAWKGALDPNGSTMPVGVQNP